MVTNKFTNMGGAGDPDCFEKMGCPDKPGNHDVSVSIRVFLFRENRSSVA
jgi:hypothetical protein